ncbi:MAG: helix-turn-helix domain-containing protein [Chloroflexi bacterium]|nr:helix-turn-helix domain-containing protein [Chloroflexota bacterium]
MRLTVREALAPTEAARECPCCHARLWITIPTAGQQLEHIARDCMDIPDLHTALARRERQVLGVLHQAARPLDHAQIAALVWADADRTHDVRTVLHRLRHKLRGSPWSIPTTPAGQGVRLVRSDSDDRQPVSIANVDAAGHAA